MRLITWNVNSLAARLPRVPELLAEHRPDVLRLQETRISAEEFPVDELREAGYEPVGSTAVDRSYRNGSRPSDHAPLLLDLD